MRSDWLQVLTLPLQWHRPFLGNRDTSPHWTEPRSPQSDALRYCIPLKGWKKRKETVKLCHCQSNYVSIALISPTNAIMRTIISFYFEGLRWKERHKLVDGEKVKSCFCLYHIWCFKEARGKKDCISLHVAKPNISGTTGLVQGTV